MTWTVRIARALALALALVVLGMAVASGSIFFNARLHPVSCPGAFLGCASNGEELGYLLALGSDTLALPAGILAFILTGPQRRRMPSWQPVTVAVLVAVDALLFPLLGGLFALILLGIVSPDAGLYVYLAVPLATGLALAFYSFRRGPAPEPGLPYEQGRRGAQQ